MDMAVAIRLMRLGKKNNPFYRIVVIDKKRKRESRYIEKIGEYNPFLENNKLKINFERLEFWKNRGALLSTGLFKLLKKIHFKKD